MRNLQWEASGVPPIQKVFDLCWHKVAPHGVEPRTWGATGALVTTRLQALSLIRMLFNKQMLKSIYKIVQWETCNERPVGSLLYKKFLICADTRSLAGALPTSKDPPRCRRERRLPLKAQTPLNPEKFAPTWSRTQDLRCYRGSCNHYDAGSFADHDVI
jgi:hypothetical protein